VRRPNLLDADRLSRAQGLGGGAMMPMSQAILMETFRRRSKRSRCRLGSRMLLGPVLGPMLGGWDHRQLQLAGLLHQRADRIESPP